MKLMDIYVTISKKKKYSLRKLYFQDIRNEKKYDMIYYYYI